MIWEVLPCSQLSGRIAVPGSKSHTIRAVIAALLAEGTSEIYSPLYSADTRSALSAAGALGAEINETRSVWKIIPSLASKTNLDVCKMLSSLINAGFALSDVTSLNLFFL